MIDAPDCGGNESALLSNNVAPYLNAIDPLHNIIYSVHAYWPLPTNASTVLKNRITNLKTSAYPFVLGEVAATSDCNDVILLDSVLKYAKQADIGWLAWSWDRDNCPARQLTTNGLYSSLTSVGNTLINNSQYGLANTAVKILPLYFGPFTINSLTLNSSLIGNHYVLQWNLADAFIAKQLLFSEDGINFNNALSLFDKQENYKCEQPLNATRYCKLIYTTTASQQALHSNIVALHASINAITIKPNPATQVINFEGINTPFDFTIRDINGRVVIKQSKITLANPISINSLCNGLYFVELKSNGIHKIVKLIKQ
jgi:hypothetical protein